MNSITTKRIRKSSVPRNVRDREAWIEEDYQARLRGQITGAMARRRRYGDVLVVQEPRARVKSYLLVAMQVTRTDRPLDDSTWAQILEWAKSYSRDPSIRKARRKGHIVGVYALTPEGRTFERRAIVRGKWVPWPE